MQMGNVNHSFLEDLNKKFEDINVQESNIQNLVSAITYYESFIPDFFSKNGEADGIRNMYSKIRVMKESGQEKNIECCDMYQIHDIYTEYVDGMINFINDIRNVNVSESTKIEEYSEKFKKAKDNDLTFIKSLYNGKIKEITSMPLSEAVSNVEFLIDFINDIKDLKTSCCVVEEAAKSEDGTVKQPLLEGCLEMLCESVNNFCYYTLKSVLTTYADINNVLTEETVVTTNSQGDFVLL